MQHSENNKYLKLAIIALCLLLSISISNTLFAQSLEIEAHTKISTLKYLIQQAEAKGINTLKEQLAVRNADVFLDFAKWDENHIAENKTYFEMVSIYKNNASQMATELPDFERGDVVKMLDECISNINKLIAGDFIRKDIPSIDWTKVVHEGNQMIFNNRPVFLSDYSWKPGVTKLTEFYGNMDGFYISPNQVINESGAINKSVVQDLQAKADGTPGNVFIAHKALPQWAIDKYGQDILNYKGEPFFLYDIDNPGAKDIVSKLIAGTVPYMAGKNYTKLGYMLANEPRWLNYKDGTKKVWYKGGVSQFTKEKFKIWLQNKHASIGELNTLWGTSFAGFEDVDIEIPIDISKIGTAQWYDYTLFNEERAVDWFSFMKSEIRKYDPVAKTHLKIMPSFFTDNVPCVGIDLEALTEMSDVIGNDIASDYNSIRGEEEWNTSKYIFGWRELFMGYDFLKSVSPEKIIFNSESHLLSGAKTRDLYMNPAFARATFWAAHTLGLNVSQIWYWPRREDGSLKQPVTNGYAGSNNQQPRVTYEIQSTMMDLNSYAEEITAMQRQRKPIRIFYSKTSAHQVKSYMDNIFELYEKLNFDGIPLGFVTKNIINKQENNNWDVIIIYKTPQVTQAEVDALNSFLDNGGEIIMDSHSVLFDEYGRTISALNVSNGQIFKVNSLQDCYEQALNVVESKSLLPEVSLVENNSTGFKGCTWRCIKNKDGNNVLSVINMGASEATIKLSLKDASVGTYCTNLLTSEHISSKSKLKPYEVLFVEVKDGEDIDTCLSDLTGRYNEMGILYPNPSNGEFSIALNKNYHQVSMSIFDIKGKEISKNLFYNTNLINYRNSKISQGTYLVNVSCGVEEQNFYWLKKSM